MVSDGQRYNVRCMEDSQADTGEPLLDTSRLVCATGSVF